MPAAIASSMVCTDWRRAVAPRVPRYSGNCSTRSVEEAVLDAVRLAMQL